MGNKPLFAIKVIDALYNDYNDANADRIGELQKCEFEEMDGWNAIAMLLPCYQSWESRDCIVLAMADLDGKQGSCTLAQALF